MPSSRHFPTLLFTDRRIPGALNRQLLQEVEDLAELDAAGIRWSKINYKNGFTSYASANELHRTSPTFAKLEKWINARVARYAKDLEYDLGGGRLSMTTCWANYMRENTHHSLHVHPLSVISGTYYVQMPPQAPAIKFEDPRLPFFMHQPPRKLRCRPESKTHIEVKASAGELVLFESWMRHEVPIHSGPEPRVSISFNYDWQ